MRTVAAPGSRERACARWRWPTAGPCSIRTRPPLGSAATIANSPTNSPGSRAPRAAVEALQTALANAGLGAYATELNADSVKSARSVWTEAMRTVGTKRKAAKDLGAKDDDLEPKSRPADGAKQGDGNDTPPPGIVKVRSAWYGARDEDDKRCDATGYVKQLCEFYPLEICANTKDSTKPLERKPSCAQASTDAAPLTVIGYDLKALEPGAPKSVCTVKVEWRKMCGGLNPTPFDDRELEVAFECTGDTAKAKTRTSGKSRLENFPAGVGAAVDDETLYLMCE